LVAALRTDMPPRYFAGPHDDSLEGTAIPISRDDGRCWSELQFLFDVGRHHASLQRLLGETWSARWSFATTSGSASSPVTGAGATP
jgi:hypothetical protein